MNKIGGFFGVLFFYGFWAICTIAYFKAIIYTAKHDQMLALVVGVFIPPVGVIHGILLFLGFRIV